MDDNETSSKEFEHIEETIVEEEPVKEEPIKETIVVEEEPIKETIVVEEEPIKETIVVEEEPVKEEPIKETIVVEDEPIKETIVVEEEPVKEEPIKETIVVEEEPIKETIVVEEEPVKEEPIKETIVVEEEPIKEKIVVEEPIKETIVVEEPIKEPELKLEEVYKQAECEENIQISFNEIPKLPSLQKKTESKTKVPTLVFIIPYRDRLAHYNIFAENMKMYLRNAPPYKIFYLHQTDTRSFNRGAMKNIGFLVVKKLYPDDYKNITLIFNDIDTMPTKDIAIKYETQRGVIKHFYGFDYTLGGIVSINAGDFELMNGFPNFWAWGYEDNMLQTRAIKVGIKIDRSVFYKIMDPKIIHLTDTYIREVNRTEFDRFLQNTNEGIYSINELEYNINFDTGFVDVLKFDTTAKEKLETRANYDLRNGPAPFKDIVSRKRGVPKMKMIF